MKKDIRRIIVHEKYKYPSHDYDISVAELSSPVPYTNTVHRICLPDASHEFHPGDEMFVTGFGARKNDGEDLKRNSNHSNLIQYSKAFKEWNVSCQNMLVGWSYQPGPSQVLQVNQVTQKIRQFLYALGYYQVHQYYCCNSSWQGV